MAPTKPTARERLMAKPTARVKQRLTIAERDLIVLQDKVEAQRMKLADLIVEAHDRGMTYREIAAHLGRPHPYALRLAGYTGDPGRSA